MPCLERQLLGYFSHIHTQRRRRAPKAQSTLKKSRGLPVPRRKFHEAAAKYLTDFALKSTIPRDAAALNDLAPYIGNLWLDQINNDSFNAFRNARQGLAIITRNAKIAVAHGVLKHTYRRRLRAAGVGLEDRKDLLGHKRHEITTHCSAAEVGQLIQAVNRVLSPCATSSATVLRVAAAHPRGFVAGASALMIALGMRGTTECPGPVPQNSLTNFEWFRGMRQKVLVGADGFEPPTFAL